MWKKKKCWHPMPTVDMIIEKNKGVVLVKRRFPPLGWAIPGGFVEYGETVETAARREAKEETGLTLVGMKQFHVYSDPKRDPRQHTIATVFTSRGKGTVKGGDDAAEAKVFYEGRLPRPLVFDHPRILRDYFKQKKKKRS